MAGDEGSPIDTGDHALSDERQRAVDELGRRAGAALRRPAPDDGVAAIAGHARNRRLVATSVVVGVVAMTIVGVLLVNRGGSEQLPASTMTVPVAPDSTTVTVVSPTTTTDTTNETVGSTTSTIGRGFGNVVPPSVESRSTVASPGEIDLQFHGGSPPAWLLIADGGRTIMVSDAGGWAPGDSFSGVIAPVDEQGAPLSVATLHSTVFLTIGITSDGRLVQLDPWHRTFELVPHPGVVTDIALTGLATVPSMAQPFWAVGTDLVDGASQAVVWYDTGLSSDDQGAVSGQASARLVATFDAVDGGRPLITADENGAFVLVPEPDGRSRLWTVDGTAATPAAATELLFSQPTHMEIGGDGALWIADSAGLHVVDSLTSPSAERTVLATPVRSLGWMSTQAGSAVLVLDATGTVMGVSASGDTHEYYRDPLATDLVGMFWSGGPDAVPQLFLVHAFDDEVIVVGRGLSG